MHKLMRAPLDDNPTAPSLSPGASYLLYHSRLLALGTLDKQGRPWTTVWGGESGFAGPVADSTMGVRHVVDRIHDPVVETLFDGNQLRQVVKEDGDGKLISGLPIDLERRKRVKLEGRIVGASLEEMETTDEELPPSQSIAQAQIIVKIRESLGKWLFCGPGMISDGCLK